MAVYTALSDADLAQLLAQYALGPATSCKGIAEGVENSNYLLRTGAGQFILTVFEKRVREEDLPFFMQVMARLAERGVPAPQPVATKTGALFTRAKGKPAAIVSFLDGVWPRAPDIGHCAAIGEVLARMHVALEGFALERANALSLDGWERLIAPRLAQAEYLRPGLARLIERDVAEVRAAWPSALPRGPIHADLFPDNALFLGERLTGVIDFYFACTDFLAYDLAVCLNAWCFAEKRDYDVARGGAMIAAYETIRPLSEAERAVLPTLCRGAALRFFGTRLADWGDTPEGALVKPKDPLEYADKLAFHRSAASAAAYGA
ncbi:MAG TPA: homoserine kinase [Vitreimonas sp.]|uniref:homoserine kinase n=1 Tax=Vitreimonas sp. TaxID=3069702 RepID=UPI002D4ED606|nr:homoserine kinase [Vitreimonas sp.]HYD89037.1 homoserine kinase [Vitreimonas sp.]